MEHIYKHIPLLAILACFALGACGVKPKELEPPTGAENKTFPKTYPAEGSE